MNVQYPEPAGRAVVLYSLESKGIDSLDELQHKVDCVEMDLDRVCDEELRSGKYSLLSRTVEFTHTGSHVVCSMGGGCDLTVDGAVDLFQARYRELFSNVLRHPRFPIDMKVELVACTDSITRNADAWNPE
ncbi:hypothetical protein HY489_01275 [Candidatus Woesearchaeota archaeon]|nr:hypothetical protein [Candidatus Woesearchaeota archaeon]